MRPVSPVLATFSSEWISKKESNALNMPISGMSTSNNYAKKSICTAKKALLKHYSNLEVNTISPDDDESFSVDVLKYVDLCHKQLCRNPHNPGPTSGARVVAKAMADQGPPGETVLQRSALLQVKKSGVKQVLTSELIVLILKSKANELMLSRFVNRRN